MTLDQLGLKYRTDKSSPWHDYLNTYETLIGQNITSLLEIGVQDGNSIRMWVDWLPNSKIYGVDIVKPANPEYIPGALCLHGDQRDEKRMREIGVEYGPFDVIVDDAGHEPEAQESCFNVMRDYVRSGGLYIVEDINAPAGIRQPWPPAPPWTRMPSRHRQVLGLEFAWINL